ncbi:sodium/glutamate symporter [Fusobacterium nucleatum subsp. nucleatum ATCC 23726]|uniref:Sodium/glutamate symporter n=3 Tax=Fusobacterium nucleatum subsp. nucleatum TaxID=76856 RepID=Q8RFC0_FUSNN|nr:sodium/glutamate symporter [Fusobacterium nucleatum]AAL94989.1 Sodium/glutamate symport carrier protein [Fusobacterium nucleatum subsp. nucleatum ATCC 25586]ALF24203.1 sodium:glutamate symporter [Fusobacterium nucleatum subsp. nucleatum ChDC F316]ALF25255.1 sodium:glutamate symporter [Fusobacterium nucleatum subsp. nucleatum]ASG26509.1 sodium/glutamate symporter [Fusobacterium nucleatum subsp. nucleatum]AVQ15178.1 sodium/glutamate symporter [Fusobacterium nucleatum subsp. nucleatum ATCC 255
MFEYQLNMAETVGFAIILLLLGRWIKKKVSFFEKFFIPAPVIGGTLFSIILLIGHQTETFTFTFNDDIKNLLMIAFFTTVGFSASLKILKKGGVGVALFLLAAVVLVILQDIVGPVLAKALGINPLLGLAAGSIPLTGGHGTSGAFGPYLEDLGATGATVVAVASATYGLIAGCLIGGPIGRRLMIKNNLKPTENKAGVDDSILGSTTEVTEERLFSAVVYIGIAMGIGATITLILGNHGIKFPAYLMGMVVAAIIRNILDFNQKQLPFNEIGIVGNISLSLFLSMALMSMKLWQLIDLAVPLIVILLVQTLLMAFFAYFITFNIMGRDYDAAVMSTGHCGFGLGATPNAMANMETFTTANGPSVKAFFIIPIVGSLFIDFINAGVIQTFATWIVNNFM